MTYKKNSDNDDANLHRSDLDLLTPALERYVSSEQPGIACFFVYGMTGTQEGRKLQRQFWEFMDKLAGHLGLQTSSYWVRHQGGNINLAGLLFSDQKLARGFATPCIETGRGKQIFPAATAGPVCGAPAPCHGSDP